MHGRTRRVRPSETKRLEGEGEEGETGVMGAAARFAHSSRSNPKLQRRKDSNRLISPNRLVYAVDRYHLRAFCHKTATYRDFVLTRIFEAEPFESKGSKDGVELKWVSEENDKAWLTRKVLRFRPNQNLPKDVIQTLKKDFPVVNGVLTIECNEATAPYIEMKFARPDFKYRIPQWVKLGS